LRIVKVELEELKTPGPDGDPGFWGQLLAGGQTLPRALQAVVELDESAVRYTVVLLLDSKAARYKVATLELASTDGLTAAQVRDTALPRLLHAIAASDAFAVSVASRAADRQQLIQRSTQAGLASWRERAATEAGRPGPSAEVLTWVARVYVWFSAVGGRPAKGVQDALGIPARTASRWISIAREQGLIGGDDGTPSDSPQ
jgi:hypothetical protein